MCSWVPMCPIFDLCPRCAEVGCAKWVATAAFCQTGAGLDIMDYLLGISYISMYRLARKQQIGRANCNSVALTSLATPPTSRGVLLRERTEAKRALEEHGTPENSKPAAAAADRRRPTPPTTCGTHITPTTTRWRTAPLAPVDAIDSRGTCAA
jgi:hypothetical protein